MLAACSMNPVDMNMRLAFHWCWHQHVYGEGTKGEGGGQWCSHSSQRPKTFCFKPVVTLLQRNRFWKSHRLKKNTANRTREVYSTPQIGKRMKTEPENANSRKLTKGTGISVLLVLNCPTASYNHKHWAWFGFGVLNQGEQTSLPSFLWHVVSQETYKRLHQEAGL